MADIRNQIKRIMEAGRTDKVKPFIYLGAVDWDNNLCCLGLVVRNHELPAFNASLV